MKNDNKWSATECPEDIAGAIVYKLYDNGIGAEKADKIRDSISRALEWVKTCSENEYNDDFWRVFYTAMEDLKNDIEDDIPWWDRED